MNQADYDAGLNAYARRRRREREEAEFGEPYAPISKACGGCAHYHRLTDEDAAILAPRLGPGMLERARDALRGMGACDCCDWTGPLRLASDEYAVEPDYETGECVMWEEA